MTGRWTRRRLIASVPVGFSMLGAAAFAKAQKPPDAGSAGTPQASPGATPIATPMGTPTVAARPVSVASDVTITMTDDGYRPSLVQATNGHDLEVTLVNTGSRPHAFQIPKLKVDVTVKPGERTTITIEQPPLGEFPFTSDAPGDEDMTGMIVFYI